MTHVLLPFMLPIYGSPRSIPPDSTELPRAWARALRKMWEITIP